MNQGPFLLCILFVLGLFSTIFANGGHSNLSDPYIPEYVVVTQDTVPPIEDRYGDFINDSGNNPFDLKDPNVIDQKVEYDPESGYYIISEKIGDDYFRMPTYMTFEEYLDWRAKKQQQDYFDRLAGVSTGDGSSGELIDPIEKYDIKNSLVDRLFGGTAVDIRPQGNIDLTFGVDFQRVDNPILTLRQRRQGGFDFDMGIQMNVTGKIGEKLNLSTNYNTQATFDFENQMKLEYNSDAFTEDEIIKKIEAGNVSLPLRGSLIQGSQSLFGLKTELQFGKLRLTGVASQQKSKREELQIQGGSQLQTFSVQADEYDENRHFFLSHYNRDVFTDAVSNLPYINSLFKINRIEVWVTNDRNVTEGVRDIVALTDLGEPTRITNDNPLYQAPPSPRHLDITGENALPGRNLSNVSANDLYDGILNNSQTRFLDRAVSTLQSPAFGFQQATDFEKVRARPLAPTEFTYHPELGFISVNVNLRPDQVLGVAYEYTYNGEIYTVGEFSNDIPISEDTLNVLYVKMLKSTTQRVDVPSWDLMMKNVYSIGAFQVSQQDFKLDIFYEDPGGGQKRFLPETNLEGEPLLRVFNLDKLNVQGDPQPDGIFDFVPGVTINTRNGRVMFPVLEPFGTDLSEKIEGDVFKRRYSYQELYDSTITRAREYPEFNRFTIRGSYKSSVSSEISLGAFNLPQGSVRVRAGGQVLIEGQDYEVDYNIGRVKILRDDILNSGVPINVSFEDNTLFGFQTKTLLGLRADYEINKNFNIGGTYLHLFERPFTQKVNIGDDPINNRVVGLDINYSKEAPWLTRFVDRIPLIDTKEASNISFMAEVAALKPGHSSAVNQGEDADGNKDKGGIVYLDDFEGSASSFDLRTPANRWILSSVPQNDLQNNNPGFPEANVIDSTLYGVNRAKLNWYRVDQSVLSQQDQSDRYARIVRQEEVFPNLQVQPGQLGNIQSFDLTYYPDERGPYNFDLPGGTQYSAGLNNDGKLIAPETRWAGIMRDLNTNDFQAANIEYLEFWVLNPFMDKADGDQVSGPGNIYINLGNVSEDILRDSRLFFENGLRDNARTDTTEWGRIPRTQAVTNAFDNEPANRVKQDVGLDGFDNVGEREHFADVLAVYEANLTPNAFNEINADPSNDDFVYFNDEAFGDDDGVYARYSRFNNPEGNSKAADGNQFSSATNLPDTEDINNDNTLNETESYFQYKIPIEPDGVGGMEFNQFVVDSIQGAEDTWYRIKVPLNQFTSKVGGIQDFRSIRFIRMYMNGFDQRTTFRFARFELVRNQWRRYQRPFSFVADAEDEDSGTLFDVNAVNIEENSSKYPFAYVLPPGIQRERSIGAFPDVLQNEQSQSIEVCNLKPGDARAIYKIINLDMRVFKRLQMFVHAEVDVPPSEGIVDESDLGSIAPGELSMFIRLGSDFENNYYEYEIPLEMSTNRQLVPTSDEYKEEVWLEGNNVDFLLELFKNAKVQRNQAQGVGLDERFGIIDPDDPDNKVVVKGNPNLGLVKGVMIGVRNNRPSDLICAQVWVNELRVNGFDERGGLAALARLDMQLADFGNVSLSGNFSSIGWGSLEQKVAQRAREEVLQYDAATSLELGKFLPEKSGIKIPFYAQYSNTTRTPEYDPYDLDIPLKEKLAAEPDKQTRDEIKEQAVDYTSIKSMNFTNVRKERTNTERTPMPWDIENFSFTYAYSQTERRDPIIASDKLDTHRGAVDYSYSRKPTYITPLSFIKKDKYLKLFTEFNFNPLPNAFTFNTAMDRQISETRYRFAGDDPAFNTFFNKRFTWDRNYNLQWDLTKSLKVNFSAINNSVIDELPNYDPFAEQFSTEQQRKDFIWENIQNWGRTKNYGHTVNASYTLPMKHIPFMDWVTVKAQYGGTYNWASGAYGVIDYAGGYQTGLIDTIGNVIQNTQTRQINGDFDFEKLYNKSKYLKKINSKKRKGKGKSGLSRGGRGDKDSDDEADDGSGKNKKGKSRKGRDKEESDDRKKKTKDGKDELALGGKDGKDSKDGKGGKDSKGKNNKKDKKKKEREPTTAERVILRPLMMLRKARLSYSENFGTTIPGYMPRTQLMGMGRDYSAPGWDFVAGWQPDINPFASQTDNDWLNRAAGKEWITENIFLNQQVLQNYSQNYDGKITIEPFNDFRLELEANKQFTENSSLYFRDTTLFDDPNDLYGDLVHSVPRDVGSYTISYFAMNTLFDSDIFGLFEQFSTNREVISSRLGASTGNTGSHSEDEGYLDGFGQNQLDVLIPAFLSTYTGKDPNTFDLDVFKTLPKLNWRLTYNGLSKLDMFKDIFQSVSLSHAYRSTLTMNSFNTNAEFIGNNASVYQTRNDLTDNYESRFEIPQITISEQFSPLIGLDIRLKNDMNFRTDFKKARNLDMIFRSNQLSETKTTEYVIGFGYRIKDAYISFLHPNDKKKKKRKKKKGKKGKNKKDDDKDDDKDAEKEQGHALNFKFDFSYRDDITVNHFLSESDQEPIPTRGARTIRISPSVDYDINKRLNVRLFYDYSKTNPKTSASFPITTTQAGVTIRFSLQ